MQDPATVLPNEGDSFDFGGLGVQWKIEGGRNEGRFTVVHHPIAPHALAAPPHFHHNEDEYFFVLRGSLGALLGKTEVVAEAGSWAFKPRGQWHTFWNPRDTPCEIIEIISPVGFENFFHEVTAVWGNFEGFKKINARYDLDMDFESVHWLCERFGLTFPEL